MSRMIFWGCFVCFCLPLTSAADQPVPHATIEKFQDWVVSLAWNSDGTILACGSYEKVVLWSLPEKKILHEQRNLPGYVSSLCFSEDDQQLIAGCYQRVILLDVETRQVERKIKGHRGQVTGVKLLPGNKLLTCADDGSVRLWNLQGEQEQIWQTEDPVTSLAVSPDGKQAVWTLGDETRVTHPGSLVFLDLENWKEQARLELHKSVATAVAYTADEKAVLSASFDETIIVTDSTKFEPTGIFKEHARPVNSVVILPNSQLVATGSGGRFKEKNELKIWQLDTGRVLFNGEPHTERISCIAVSPGGKWLATGSHDQKVMIWETAAFLPPASE